ncbi:MAG TPA: hypothetical protein VLC09_14085, partial [Polyangiaceae bacterium]|nr:hypothetical protein [Polyangiaceae bacterium]
PKYLLRKCAEVEAPLLYASPTLLATVAMLTPEERPLHAAMTSGTLLQRNWFDGIRKKVRHLHQQYGCSEAGCISLGEDIDEPNQLGRPLPHIELVAGSSADEPGEIIARSTEGRTIATRDLGYLADGHLHFVSRLDDMINVSGLNVYPSEVEEVVLELPDVTEAVVYKRRHGFGSDQVSLRFVAARTLAPEHVREWCSARLASHQVPMHVTQVPTIPKLPNGKTSRNALAEADARGEFS